MRRLFLVVLIGILWILGLESLQAQNRIATESDVTKYGTYITPGDLILDKPTNPVPFADGINQLRYTKVSASFPGLREGGTIWIDGDKIGPICEFRLLNGTETIPWRISSAMVKPIPNTRIHGIYTKNSYGGFLYLIQGLKNLTMDGNSKAYPGLVGLKKGEFVKGRFGFAGTSTGIYEGYHVYSISVLDGGKFYFTGFEGEHGFSVLRFQGGSYNWIVSLEVDNFYIHDTSSEGMYIKATHAPPLAYGPVKISNGIIARSGSEALQLQHLTGESWVHNITVLSPACGYLNNFQPNQDTGIQLGADGGTTIIEKIIVDSWGSHAWNLFGSPFVSDTKKVFIKDIALLHGRGEGIYPHNSTRYGQTWEFENIHIGKVNYQWYVNNKAPKTDWLIGAAIGGDTLKVKNVRWDGSTTLFQNTAKFVIGPLLKSTVPDAEYVNSGFPETADKIRFYQQFYGKWLSGKDFEPVVYEVGEVLEDRETGFQPVFVKCLIKNSATTLRPKYDPINYMILSWDENTIRSDQPGWNALLKQFPYPPDDLRVKWNSYYGQLDIGFVEQAPTLDDLLSIIDQKDSTINILQGKLTGIFQDIDKYK